MKNGSTIKEQLESVWRQTGRKPKELQNLVSLPENCYLIWKYFLDLHNARGSNGFGVDPISYTEIKNYFDLMGIDPDPQEIELLKRFDYKYLEIQSKETSE